jgi:hypothetical protein
MIRCKTEALEIRVETLESGEVIALLEEHLSEMHTISPPESVHALAARAIARDSSRAAFMLSFISCDRLLNPQPLP